MLASPDPAPPRHRRAHQIVLAEAVTFSLVGLVLQIWRLLVLQASMDQGIFLQVLMNGLRAHPFESILSSLLSTNVIHAGEMPALGYQRLGQHFTPILVVWMPLVGILGRWALPLIQVDLITAAGLVLFQLCRQRLPVGPAFWITLSFSGANAMLGPSWGNFTDLCQLPLAIFTLLLGLERRSAWLIVPGGAATGAGTAGAAAAGAGASPAADPLLSGGPGCWPRGTTKGEQRGPLPAVHAQLFTLSSNPNRSLSWLIPDGIRPWVYSTPWRPWQHEVKARSVLAAIPPGASVAASTPLIPPLADRERLVRFPDHAAVWICWLSCTTSTPYVGWKTGWRCCNWAA